MRMSIRDGDDLIFVVRNDVAFDTVRQSWLECKDKQQQQQLTNNNNDDDDENNDIGDGSVIDPLPATLLADREQVTVLYHMSL
jgi:hypothetical protein